MTPAARLSAAIHVLDTILQGTPADAALTAWGRANRYAGASDRYALRDLVFSALRCKRSHAALGGGMTGRSLILGGLRDANLDKEAISALFSGAGYAPAMIGPADQARAPNQAEALDLPDWLMQPMQHSLGQDFARAAQALRRRAPVFLRVNPARASRPSVVQELQECGLSVTLIDNLPYALQVVEGERKIASLPAYLEGRIEVQDAASQAVIAALTLPNAGAILDYCAGAGGKILAIAAQASEKTNLFYFAHDANPRRMADLPPRAARAGAKIEILNNPADKGPYALILTDVPCSGSGSWRRDPQGKWALTPQSLAKLHLSQAQILDGAAMLLAQGGQLAYSTCSVLRSENEDQIAAFLQRHPDFVCHKMQRFGLIDGSGGDGFFVAILSR